MPPFDIIDVVVLFILFKTPFTGYFFSNSDLAFDSSFDNFSDTFNPKPTSTSISNTNRDIFLSYSIKWGTLNIFHTVV